jgi:hypothetical protein
MWRWERGVVDQLLLSYTLLHKFRAAFVTVEVGVTADRDSSDINTSCSREELMLELGLDDYALRILRYDDDNTWRQALSSGLIGASVAVSNANDDDWNASLAEVESMMSGARTTDADDAWDHHEHALLHTSVDVSSDLDHTSRYGRVGW